MWNGKRNKRTGLENLAKELEEEVVDSKEGVNKEVEDQEEEERELLQEEEVVVVLVVLVEEEVVEEEERVEVDFARKRQHWENFWTRQKL